MAGVKKVGAFHVENDFGRTNKIFIFTICCFPIIKNELNAPWSDPLSWPFVGIVCAFLLHIIVFDIISLWFSAVETLSLFAAVFSVASYFTPNSFFLPLLLINIRTNQAEQKYTTQAHQLEMKRGKKGASTRILFYNFTFSPDCIWKEVTRIQIIHSFHRRFRFEETSHGKLFIPFMQNDECK